MIQLASSTIDTVNRLLATNAGLTVCHDPPADPATDGVFGSLPPGLHPELSDHIVRRFPRGLFRHQRAAAQHLLSGRHTVVATRTSSGKSLIYSIPVFDRLLTEPTSTALFLFPQKALARLGLRVGFHQPSVAGDDLFPAHDGAVHVGQLAGQGIQRPPRPPQPLLAALAVGHGGGAGAV